MPPRKPLATRQPDGSIRRKPQTMSPTEARRLMDQAKAGLRDQVWGTPLGWLRISDRINDRQFRAGKRWAELTREYSAAMASPHPPRSANLDPVGGTPPDPDSPQGLAEAQEHTFTVHTYLATLELLKLTGGPVSRVVMQVCDLGMYPASEDEHKILARGLDALAAWWAK